MIYEWSENFSYAIGLFTADGCLSSDKRHLDFTSKDREQVLNFRKCFNLKNKIAKKSREKEKDKKYYRVQFGNVKLFKFLQSIGLTPKKSLTIGALKIPIEYFPDFLRGLFDGDGCFIVYYHPESFRPQIRVRFNGASKDFLVWLQQKILIESGAKGYIKNNGRCKILEYAIKESLIVLNYMYYSLDVICLSRKFKKINRYVNFGGRGEIGRRTRFRT